MDENNVNPSNSSNPASQESISDLPARLSNAQQDEQESLIFNLLLVNKWFLIPASVTYLFFLSTTSSRASVYSFNTPTVLYISFSLLLIIILWITHRRLAEGTTDPRYALYAKLMTVMSYGLDVMYIFFLVFNQSRSNLLWLMYLFPISFSLLVPRFKHGSNWMIDGVFSAVVLGSIVCFIRSFESLSSPERFVECDLLICLSSIFFLWVVMRMTSGWLDTVHQHLSRSLELTNLWTDVLRQFPVHYFLTNERGEVLISSYSTTGILPLPESEPDRWPESTEAVRNALLLRFHAEEPMDKPITLPDDSREHPVTVHPTFFGVGNQRYCIAVVQEEHVEVGAQMGLIRSDRLAIAGQIAAGLAHEIGNPLGVIRSCAEYLRQKSKENDPNKTEYELIETKSKRCQNLIDRLLSLASPKRDTPGIHDLRDILNGAISMVKYQAGEREFEFNFPPREVKVYVNEGQVSAVFVNLLLNALQSMEKSPLELKIQVLIKVRENVVIVDVTDEGCGIPSNEMDRIFDPFFTKKASGTGLGLYIVHQIVTSLGGHIDAASNVGSGTTFTVRLPLYKETDETPLS